MSKNLKNCHSEFISESRLTEIRFVLKSETSLSNDRQVQIDKAKHFYTSSFLEFI